MYANTDVFTQSAKFCRCKVAIRPQTVDVINMAGTIWVGEFKKAAVFCGAAPV